MHERLNTLSQDDLTAELKACCGSAEWSRAFLRQRPFDSAAAVMAAADAAFDRLPAEQWRDAFEVSALRPPADDDATGAAVRLALRMYEERFGQPFVAVMTTGAADELLMRIRIRLGNDTVTEARLARDEQRRLTRLCLQRLITAAAPA